MSYAFVNSAKNSANLNSITYSPTAGNLVVIDSVTSSGAGNPTATCSDNLSDTWVKAIGMLNWNASSFFAHRFYLLNCPSGITSITLTYNGGTPGTCNLGITEWSGITGAYLASASGDQQAPGTAADAITTANVNVSSVPALLLGFCYEETGNSGITAGTGFTIRNSGNYLWEDRRITSNGNVPATFTSSSHGGTDGFGTIASAFAEGAGGAAPILMGQSCL